MTLEAPECSRRFLLHIVPHGFQRLRHGGCLATRWKARALRQCRSLLGPPSAPPPREQPSAGEWRRQRTGSAHRRVLTALFQSLPASFMPPVAVCRGMARFAVLARLARWILDVPDAV